jgi:hemoglobin-like flavoprotein
MMSALSKDDATHIRTSFAVILADSDRFSRDLYNRLFERAPAARAMFTSDMDLQREKLVATLATVVKNCEQLDTLDDTVVDLGRRHVGYGVKAADYDDLRTALVETMEATLGERLTEQAKAAWLRLYDAVVARMLSAA